MTLTVIDLKYPFDGYAMIEDDMIYLSVVIVRKEHRGKGLFRKFIEDTKAAYRVVKVPQPSPFLKTILLRYGFKEMQELFEAAGEWIEVMVWEGEMEEAEKK